MPDVASFTYIDHGFEKATVVFNIRVITAANLASLQADVTDLVTAAGDITRGLIHQRILTHRFPGSGALPTAEIAQREQKWVIGYTDVSTTIGSVPNPYYGKNFTVEAAIPELAGHLSAVSDYADLAETDIAAFVTAFEAYVRSPTGGATQVTYIKLAGRNN